MIEEFAWFSFVAIGSITLPLLFWYFFKNPNSGFVGFFIYLFVAIIWGYFAVL
tara:strand:- start:1344 stop:1502 length:159 start_codon:yes stop_codon:yes gene_type:complete